MKSIALSLLCTLSLLATESEDLSQLTTSHTAFAFSLYKEAHSATDNLLFSPHSIADCLSLVYIGARGETERQMARALHLTLDAKALLKAAPQLNQSLTPHSLEHHSYQYTSANALFVDQSIFLLTDFRYAVEQQFKAFLDKINFTSTKEALATINNWVSDKTNHNIPQILQQDDLNAGTRLVLVNALYFQGNWKFPFDLTKTQEGEFHPLPDTRSQTSFMQQTEHLPYYANELLQMLALPFKGKTTGGGEIAFVVVLPKSADNFEMVQTELAEQFPGWLSSLQPTYINLKIPRFTHKARLDLKKHLQELGMEDPFNEEANFTGIDGMRDLMLDAVVHEATLSINEQGACASAATAATLGLKSIPMKETPLPYYADHPFFYFLVDLKSQEMLFMGTMVKPP
jgi:serpin B